VGKAFIYHELKYILFFFYGGSRVARASSTRGQKNRYSDPKTREREEEAY
jgi:hypothetical protein